MLKQIADPVLGTITIEDPLILELLETKELNRLRNIGHLGLVHFVYPGATHNRYAHSLGVYELSRRLLQRMNYDVPKDVEKAIMISALLHDIGHGPMSHLFEPLSVIEHEEYTIKLIKDEKSEVRKILEKEEGLLEKVINIISKSEECKYKYAIQIVSSQIDVDRQDYLLRDSHYCGTSYGLIDSFWLFKNAMIINNELVFDIKTKQVIENFLLGRYHMNESVYRHKKNIAIQEVFRLFWERLFEIIDEDSTLAKIYPSIIKIAKKQELTYDEFISLDDDAFWTIIKQAHLFEDEKLNKIAHYLINGIVPEFTVETEGNEFTSFYTEFNSYVDKKENQVNLYKDGEIVKISDVSSLIGVDDGKGEKLYISVKI